MSDRHRESPHDHAADDALLLAQIKAVLAPMPAVDRRRIAQILAAARDRRRTPWQRLRARGDALLERWRFATSPLVRGATLAAAALAVGFVSRGFLMRPPASTPQPTATTVASAPAATAAAAPLQPVEATADAASLRVPTQFLLDARDVPTAAQVSVVGDFNDWNVTATPLTLENGVWTGTRPLAPGRHVYAFVVNGTTWVADPRAPPAADTDFGRPGSIIIVQAP